MLTSARLFSGRMCRGARNIPRYGTKRRPASEGLDMSAFLRLENIGKRFGEHVVLRSISLEVEQGEFLTLLGESGSGKTTLLRILAGFEEPTSGRVLLEDARLD